MQSFHEIEVRVHDSRVCTIYIYIYMFSFQINISIQVVILMYDMVLWSVQMNMSFCMNKHIWHYVCEMQMLEYVCNVVYRVTAKACLSIYVVSK